MRKRYITVLAGILFSMVLFTGCGSRRAAEREAELQDEIHELRQELDDLRAGQDSQGAGAQSQASGNADDSQTSDNTGSNQGTALRTRSPATAVMAAVAVRRMLRSALRKHGTSLLHGWKAQRRQIFPLSWTGTTAGMCMKARSSTTGWSMSLRSTPIQAIS